MKSQVGYIEVVVPPQILDASSSTDVIASEGSNVTLTCKATGHPQPQIQWKREDRKEIPLQTPQGKKYVGEYLFYSSWVTTLCLDHSCETDDINSLVFLFSPEHDGRVDDDPPSDSSAHGSPSLYRI